MVSKELVGEVLGYIAAVAGAVMNIPQIVAVVKSKNTSSLSMLSLILNLLCCGCWFAYGILSHSIPVIVSNSLWTLSTITLLIMKVIWHDPEKHDHGFHPHAHYRIVAKTVENVDYNKSLN